jgi:gluconolactonase
MSHGSAGILAAMVDLVAPGAVLEQLFTGTSWGEGPVWLPELGRLRWSDIPQDRVLEYDPASGRTSVYATGVEYTNGRTIDRAGLVVQCSHGRRRVERDIGGCVTPIVERWAGGRFNSPNDVVVSRDGAVWFTDPPYGIHASGREGYPGESEYGECYVFRFDERTGEVEPVVTDMVHPNGLAFAPDERVLYVSDTAYLQVEGGPRELRAYDVVEGRCYGGRRVTEVRPGATDGFRVDEGGRIWSSSADSVQVLTPEGDVLLKLAAPETISNLCFGGADGRDLYVTGETSLYRVRTAVRSAEVLQP